jgi:UDP-2-acetamido-3-amino-2,3-dideoxy-glucuronate N-acetyltransferase
VIHPSARVHPSADLEADVAVGPDTAIWQRAQIREGARIGTECVIGRDVFVDVGVVLGDRVKVQNAALLYRGLTVEDNVFVGPGAIVTNDRFPRAVTASGKVAHAGDWELSPVVLRAGCSVGAGAVIVAGVEVGAFATVGAGAVVTRDVSGHALVVGNPARRLGWVCACGRRLQDSTGHPAPAAFERYAIDTDLVCTVCGRHYGYVSVGETLEERTGPRQAAPA